MHSRFRLLLLAFLSSSWAALAAAEVDGNRYAVVLESKAVAGDSTDLKKALARQGYQGACQGEWRLAVDSDCLQRVFNELQHQPGAMLLVYHNGNLSLLEGAVQMNGLERPIELAKVFERLKGTFKNAPSVAVLLDVRSAEPMRTVVDAIGKQLAEFKADVTVLIVRGVEDKAGTPPRLAAGLQRALTYDRSADADGDDHLTIAEFATYLREKLGSDAEVALVAPPGKRLSLEIGCFPPLDLDGIVQGLAEQALDILERDPCDVVGIPDFVESRGNAVAGATRSDLGFLQRYLAAQLQARLGQRLGMDRIVTHERLVAALEQSQVTPKTPDQELGKLRDALRPKGPAAILRGTATINLGTNPATLTVEARLVRLGAGQTPESIALYTATATLQREESAMTGCFNMGTNAGMFPGLNWNIGQLGKPVKFPPHPMSNDGFPLCVRLKVNGRSVLPRFSDDKQQLYASVESNDEYVIAIENRSRQDLFLRLLVDGRNTLPDRTLDGAGPLEPAQYVSLTHARCWFCEARSTYQIAGFYTDIGTQQAGPAAAQLRTFKVTDAQPDRTSEEFRDQLGIITAAFYEAVPKEHSAMAAQPRYATKFGRNMTDTVRIYSGDYAPGPLLGDAPINIRYGY